MLVRFLSPPEMPFICTPPIRVFEHYTSPSLTRISSTLSFISSLLKLVRSLAAKRKDSLAVNVSNNTSSYYTNPPNLPKSLFYNNRLLTLTSPVILDPKLRPNLYPMILRNEVLPLPLAPIMAIISPGLAYPDKLCKICISFGPTCNG